MYLSTQLYYKTLVAPPENLTISETENGWFEIMVCRAIRGEWIKSRNTSQNGGFDSKKYSVRFQTDRRVVLCTTTVASMADRKKQPCCPQCLTESCGTLAIQ